MVVALTLLTVILLLVIQPPLMRKWPELERYALPQRPTGTKWSDLYTKSSISHRQNKSAESVISKSAAGLVHLDATSGQQVPALWQDNQMAADQRANSLYGLHAAQMDAEQRIGLHDRQMSQLWAQLGAGGLGLSPYSVHYAHDRDAFLLPDGREINGTTLHASSRSLDNQTLQRRALDISNEVV